MVLQKQAMDVMSERNDVVKQMNSPLTKERSRLSADSVDGLDSIGLLKG